MLLVGTSGWQYADWRGHLYPTGMPQRLWLEHYAGAFATVEVNNAFYRLPERSTFESWRERTPEDFVVAVKMSRYLTHVKRLHDPAEPVARFLSRALGLGHKLGPVLLQLPPTLPGSPRLLDDTLARFREVAGDRVRVAVEPRHFSWWTAEIRDVLTRQGAALCWADRCGRPVTPLWRTAEFVYLRLHEGRAEPRPRYGVHTLDRWLSRIEERAAVDAYVYFNNDPGAAAVYDASTFGQRAARRGLSVTRTPELAGHRAA